MYGSVTSGFPLRRIFSVDAENAEEPKAASWHRRLFLGAGQSFELVLGMLYTCFNARVFMIEDHAVANMIREMRCPNLGFRCEVFL